MSQHTIGDKVRVTVGDETHRGTVTAQRCTTHGAAVVVAFWHQGRHEEIEYFENDGALRWEAAAIRAAAKSE